MKKTKCLFLAAAGLILAAILLAGGIFLQNARQPGTSQSGQIYLYGEALHDHPDILEKELELWEQYYHKNGMRHLFVEHSYFSAELLNLWMQAENDEILDNLTQESNLSSSNKHFFRQIKENCPETIFHGTDIGHSYNSAGQIYLDYLEENGQKDSEQYALACLNIEQGKNYYAEQDDVYRENCMVENFMAEYDRLIQEEGPTDIMGIYGAAHTGLDSKDFSNQVPCMANQLQGQYGELVHSEVLPIQTAAMTVAGKEYPAQMLMEYSSASYQTVEVWQLENAYEDFKDSPAGYKIFSYENLHIPVGENGILLLNCITSDGQTIREYYRNMGDTYQGTPCASQFFPEEAEPLETGTIEINGKEYEASYFGKQDLTSFSEEYQYREYWRLEDAYEDFKGCPTNRNILPADNFPVPLEEGQVFVIDYTAADGEVTRQYYRTDGNTYQDMPCANEFLLEGC